MNADSKTERHTGVHPSIAPRTPLTTDSGVATSSRDLFSASTASMKATTPPMIITTAPTT